ncbi:MAG: flagellar motor protein MotB [Sideroxydans sp.]|nr:flagellar motor protein MotB [Sideroxydans sp.]
MARPKSRTAKSGKKTRPIVVKRITRKTTSLRNSGTWKIAYADFVTAMMAFFLLMWLIGSSSASSLRGISEYFKTPLMVALMGGKSTSDVDSIITGGSNSPTEGGYQVKKGDIPPTRNDMKDAKINLQLQEIARLQHLKQRLEDAIATKPAMQKFKDQLLIDITNEGLRIQILDKQNRPMFNLGSTTLQPYTIEILREIGAVLNEVPNKVSLSGHTDATPYQGGAENYSNWDLSIGRANASRRELIAGGMDPAKIMRVVGLASSALFDPENPLSPSNRRISIIVMNRAAEQSAGMEGDSLTVDSDAGS